MVVLEIEQVPDSALVADAQRGSADAFAALYERHHPRILRHCRARIGATDAADAAQETFLRAWRAIDRFGGDGRFQPWLRTIATNVCIDQLRRSVLELREWEGWTYERIADHEQLDLSAVKSLLWRARKSLRRELLLASAQGRLAAVAVPVLAVGPSSPPPPPPVAAAPVVVTTTTAPPTPGVVRVSLARPTPTTVVATLAPSTTTSTTAAPPVVELAAATVEPEPEPVETCLLYTSDAADE